MLLLENRDFREFVELLSSSGVRFLIVGGHAVALHGYPRFSSGQGRHQASALAWQPQRSIAPLRDSPQVINYEPVEELAQFNRLRGGRP